LTASEGSEYSYTVTAIDIDGDDLTFNLTRNPEGMVIAANGKITWTPENGVTEGPVTVDVTDGTETVSQLFTIIVGGVNDAPTITEETASITTNEDTEGSITLNATDIDGDTINWSVSSVASNGVAVVNGSGASQVVSYTPSADFNGVDTFTVQITDGIETDTLEVNVTVTAVNDSPVFANAGSTSAVEGSLYQYTPVVTDIDDANNGTDLTFTLIAGPDGMNVSATGVLTWTPPNGVSNAEVTLQVADGGEDASVADSQTWTILVGDVNDAPSITSIAPTTATEDVQYQYQVQVTDPDDSNNGTDLTFTLTSAPEGMTVSTMGLIQWTPENLVTTAQVEVQVADGGESGVLPVTQGWTINVTPVNDAPEITSDAVTVATEDEAYSYTVEATDVDIDTVLTFSLTTAPEGMVIDSATGQITWTPENGTDTANVTVAVFDGTVSTTQEFVIDVSAVNDAPVITSAANERATEDEAYSYVVTAEDIDGDDLIFSLTTKPTGMTIDANSGAISWTPANNVTSEVVTVQVSDGVLTASQTFTIVVTAVNDAPEITSSPVTVATEDTEYNYTVVAADVDSDSLTFSLTEFPESMVIDAATGVISWTPENGINEETVRVEVTDGFEIASQTFVIIVSATNDAPEITEGETATLTTGEDIATSLTLNATDIDGDDLSWLISSAATNGEAVVSGTGTSQTIEYTPIANFNGPDSFTVQVSDGVASDTILVSVTVEAVNDAPVITSAPITGATEGLEYTYTVQADDVDTDTLMFSLNASPEGMTIHPASGVITWTPANDVEEGVVTVEVTDSQIAVTQEFTITVRAVNDAPVIDSAPITVATEDEAYSYIVTATDIDGDTLAYSLTTFPAGMAIDAATGVITWTPANGVTSESVTVEVTDGQAIDSQTFTVTVTAVNDAPEITEVSATIDTDEDNTGSVILNATDVDGDTITWSIAANGTNGSAVVSGTGASQTINYTPNANFNGADSFTVQVSDNQATDTLVVNVTVNAANDAPVITSESVTTATEDEAYGYTVTASDVDDDTLEFSLTVAPEGMSIDSVTGVISWTPENGVTSETVTVQVSDDSQATATQTFTITVTPVNDAPTITSSPITGATEAVEYTYTVVANDIDGDSLTFSLSANPAGMVIDSASGVITWTPANGVDEGVVTVDVFDGTETVSQTFTIIVGAVNDAPVITEGATTTLATDEDTTANLILNATDADGDDINWNISGAASNGSATVSGTGASKTVSYTPAANFDGTDSFTVQVSDGTLSDTIVVSVTVNAVADVPVITEGETSAQSTNEDTSSAFALNATDVDGGALTWTISSAATNGVATVSGTGVSQTVNYVPDANYNGTDTFVVQVSDDVLADSITVTMTVVAVNDLPVITSEAVTTATEGQVYTYLPAANDVDGDTLTWNVGTAPASMSVNSTTGELTWTPGNGVSSALVTLIVNDDTGSVTQTFTINVTAVNDAPVITEGESVTVTMDEDATPQAFSLVLNATDVDNSAAELTWSLASAASNGSATVSGTGNSKVVNYTPNANYNGADSFTVDVSDGTETDTITVNVTVEAANDAPVITEATAAIVTDEDVAGSVTLNATDIDTDVANITWTILTPATKGTASVNASNTGTSMLVTYAPTVNTNGTDSFVVQITDGELTDTITVDVTVNAIDDAPAIAQGDSVALNTNENTLGSVALNGIDIDTDAANLSWTVTSAASNGVASISGSGANVSADYIPNASYSGVDSFVVELSDGTSTDTITVNVTVNSVNAAPVITNGATATMTTDEDTTVTLSLSATDSDGDSLTWSITSGASKGGVAVDSSGLVTYVPAADANGSDTFTVQVSDAELTDSIDVTVTINAVNDVPVITEGSASTLNVNEDETGSLTFNATDADNDLLTWSLSSGALSGIVTRNGSEFSYTPNIDFNGSDSFTVAVSDGTVSATNVVTVTISSVNDAPSVTSAEITSATQGQVYAYDVTASDVEGDGITYGLTTSPSGMQIDTATGEIRWIPSAAGTETVVVSVSDGSATGTQTFDIVVAAEPAVAGRAVKGVLANALVEAFIYDSYDTDTRDHVWNTLGTTTTDANGYFGFDLGTQNKPVRIRVTSNASTTMVCDAPSGCLLTPPAVFGDSGAPAEGMILDTIVSGADFAGPIAVTPMTHMAATWLQAFPQALDDNNVLLGHRRLAKLFGFNDETYVNQRAIDLTDSFEVSQALNDDEDRVRHAIFAASLQETAVVAGLAIDSVAENVGLIFGLLGGQMPLKSGEIDVSSLNLVDESQGVDENGDPINFTKISYTGFDTFIVNAKTVGESINDGSLTAMINEFDALVTDWTPELADPSICLVTNDPELDRSACRNITTIGEATGFDQANFDRAVAPIDVVGAYLDSAKAAEAGIDQVNRDLGWLYVTTDDQTNTANMVAAFSEVLGYGVTTAVCVPQANTYPYLSCDNPVPSETFTGISPTITKANRFTNRCSLSDDESCELRVTGQAQGLTFNVTAVIPDIRYLLGGDGGFSPDNGLNMCYTGTISNTTAQLTFDDFCLKLDISGSKAELLDTFSGFSVFDYANTNKLTPALDALVAEINLEASIHNGLTLTSVKDSSIVFNMSNMGMGFIFDREVINGTKVGAIFNIYAKTLSRTNPAGETLNSIGGKDLFRLEINNDVSVLTTAKVENNIGLPPVVTESSINIGGLAPLVDVLKDYALGLVSFSEDPEADPNTAPPVVTAEQWEQILAEVEAGLVYGGTITSTIQETVVDDLGNEVDQTYIVELTSDGSIFVSNLNDTGLAADEGLTSDTAAMQIYLSGATGYIYAGETLVATAHLGNSQDGMMLSFVDGTQRSYTNANPDATAQLDSFFEFITILFPSAEEPATTN
jgi:VCBS repeat-containing protein